MTGIWLHIVGLIFAVICEGVAMVSIYVGFTHRDSRAMMVGIMLHTIAVVALIVSVYSIGGGS